MSKKIKYPAILMAHDLREGHVLYWCGQWSGDYNGAHIVNNDDEATLLDTIAAQELAKNQVVDAELVEVAIENGAPLPTHFRVKIKVSGPTIAYGDNV